MDDTLNGSLEDLAELMETNLNIKYVDDAQASDKLTTLARKILRTRSRRIIIWTSAGNSVEPDTEYISGNPGVFNIYVLVLGENEEPVVNHSVDLTVRFLRDLDNDEITEIMTDMGSVIDSNVDNRTFDLISCTTNSYGFATFQWKAFAHGNFVLDASSTVESRLLHETYEVKDYIFAPLLDGTDAITQWTSITSSTGNGIFQAHGAFLTDGWSNSGLWQLDFDVTANSWGYVGFLPICSDAINPYTDAKNKSYSLMCWEGIYYPGGLNSSVVSEDSFTKITTTNEWHHMTIIKLSDTQIKIIIDNEYESIRNVPNLMNLQTLHIGSRDNQYDRNRGGLVYLKKIRVKAL